MGPVADDVVVLVFPTVMDGTVVRWYRDVRSAMYGGEIASASRNGVGTNMASREVAMAAFDAHELLCRGEDPLNLATHRRAGFLSAELVSLAPDPTVKVCPRCDHDVEALPAGRVCDECVADQRQLSGHAEHCQGCAYVADAGVPHTPRGRSRVTVADRFGGRPR